jgi:hypothetical protein
MLRKNPWFLNDGLLAVCVSLLLVKLLSIAVYYESYWDVTNALEQMRGFMKNGTVDSILTLRQERAQSPASSALVVFDASYYLEIAKNGYVQDQLYAFPPGFPLAARLLSYTGIPPAVSLVLLSNLFHFIAVMLFYRISLKYATPKDAARMSLLFAFFPYNLVSGTVAYSDTMFLTFALLSWIFYSSKRYGWCGLMVFIASLARFQGILLYAIYSGILILHSGKSRARETAIELGALSISVLFLAYWFLSVIPCSTGMSYISVQEKYWHHSVFAIPLSSALAMLHHPLTAVNLAFSAFIMVAGILAFIVSAELGIYSAAYLAAFLSISFISGRYTGTVWPAYIAAGKKLAANPRSRMLGVLMAAAFVCTGIFLLVLELNSVFVC